MPPRTTQSQFAVPMRRKIHGSVSTGMKITWVPPGISIRFSISRGGNISSGLVMMMSGHRPCWSATFKCLIKMSDVVLCYSKTAFIDEDGKPIRSFITRPFFQDPISHQRFRSFLKYHVHPNECNPVLGLFRASILEKSPLIESYPASDMILLGEILLHGKFHEIPEYLFLRRDHALSSVRANPDWEDRAVWFNPSRKGKIQMPRWRWFLEWTKSILRSPIGIIERIHCFIELCTWAMWNRMEMLREIQHGANEWIFPVHKQVNNRIRVTDQRILK